MCNLNILIKTKGKKIKFNAVTLLQHTTGHSFVSNSDGEGAYFSKPKLLVKQSEKIDYSEFANEINNSRVIITHQRFSTSGFSYKYHHPFMSDDFILAHNGVVPQLSGKKESDTAKMFELFNKQFSKETKGSRKERVLETIKKVFKDLSGSWSIILYDKKTGKCYYWKNNSTSIHFWKGNDCLFISTANQESLLPEGMKKITISSNKIYEIGKDSDPVVVGDMPSVVETVYVYNNSNRVYMGLSDKKSNKKRRQDFLEKVLSEKEAEEEDYCVSCGNIFDVKDIPYSDIWRGRICEECEQQWMKY